MSNSIYSLSICGRLTMNLHSLNNEGGEGNQIQTRMVNIVGQDGQLASVNAISGDMFKHIQAEHLYHIGRGKLPLCQACEQFDSNRISADENFSKFLKGSPKPTQTQVIDKLIKTCMIDDLEGNLITEGGFSAPRKSVVEFGWVVGLPEFTRTEQYFHVKYAANRGGEKSIKEGEKTAEEKKAERKNEEEERKSNLTQSIFHRPASSGIYAAITHVEMARIGYNDISQKYVLEDTDRLARYKALLESLIYTYLQPNGAMRNTQMPHVVNFEGVISYTTTVMPAPTVSPLNDDYADNIEQIKVALSKLHPQGIEVKPFNSLAEYTTILQQLIETTQPYQLNTGRK